MDLIQRDLEGDAVNADLLWKNLDRINDKIEELELDEVAGTIFHSQACWIREGEKTLNIFYP